MINRHLADRGWSPAYLAKVSGQSKATISRITNYNMDKLGPYYRPHFRTIFAVSLALELTMDEGRELIYTAYPELTFSKEAAEKNLTVQQTDELLYDNGLPLLRSSK